MKYEADRQKQPHHYLLILCNLWHSSQFQTFRHVTM